MGSAVVGTPNHESSKFEGRERAEDPAALNGPAKHHVMSSPGVVAAISRSGLECPVEIGFGEGCHVLRYT